MSILSKLREYIDIVVAVFIFATLIIVGGDFTKTIILLLELIVIIEVVQMIFLFFKKHRIKIRYMVDAAIIYAIRELMIAITHEHIDTTKLTLLILILFSLFFMRYLSIKITYNSSNDTD
ncbi:phosphate-starvation-inducible PsiE family protein [Hydrogenimonas thermophila]|uniref:Phosphate-starvation-inducible E n=1 Tax=Hydrogenimonas thermophila TaxID=223786 RepID=A0A1I5KUG2_9BACT|nr:phosphate-starvation-inducible PsiE family protein [Hydrogenimonas thermophila]SFO88760.1 Phosphate-starvation-inducible E [Hydrogenimonas thermophila]